MLEARVLVSHLHAGKTLLHQRIALPLCMLVDLHKNVATLLRSYAIPVQGHPGDSR